MGLSIEKASVSSIAPQVVSNANAHIASDDNALGKIVTIQKRILDYTNAAGVAFEENRLKVSDIVCAMRNFTERSALNELKKEAQRYLIKMDQNIINRCASMKIVKNTIYGIKIDSQIYDRTDANHAEAKKFEDIVTQYKKQEQKIILQGTFVDLLRKEVDELAASQDEKQMKL